MKKIRIMIIAALTAFTVMTATMPAIASSESSNHQHVTGSLNCSYGETVRLKATLYYGDASNLYFRARSLTGSNSYWTYWVTPFQTSKSFNTGLSGIIGNIYSTTEPEAARVNNSSHRLKNLTAWCA